MKPECHSPLVGHAYRGSDGAVTCCLCNYEMEWENCTCCGGDGYFDGYEEDPLWYDPGDDVPCQQCGGRGGDYWCPNSNCATHIAIKIHAQKPSGNENHA